MFEIMGDDFYQYPFGMKVIPYLNEKFQNQILHRRTEMLYHYTDISGFLGIVRTQGFWISSIQFLNDDKEYVHGIELCSSLINSIRGEEIGNNGKILLEQLDSKLQNPPREHFVLSFCEDGDLLGQWRGYGHGQYGVSLGFKYSDFSNRIFRRGSNDRIWAFPVIYSDETKILVLKEILRIGLESAEKNPEYFLNEVSDMLLESIYYFLPFFKHSAFIDEREWRSVQTNFTKESDWQYPVLFRPRGEAILPYIEVILHDIIGSGKEYELKPHLPLHEVIIGPSSKQDSTHRSVEYYLNKQGMGDVAVRDSSIPFRW